MSDDELMSRVIETSYRNFHAKGFDYVCLKRSDDLTVKAYFFEGACIRSSELIFPHDHRYDFATNILSGGLYNKVWREVEAPIHGEDFNRFEYRTPLNGGNGFAWDRGVKLRGESITEYGAGDRYVCGYDEVHTLANVKPSTVIVIFQYGDLLPVGVPTHTYSHGNEPPSLSGLYDKHTPDQITARLGQLERLKPGICRKFGVLPLIAARAA